MSHFHPSSFLRRVLFADAATSAASGFLMLFGAGPLEGLLAIPAGFLTYAGLSLLPFAALVWFLGTRESLSRAAVWAVIVINALWAAESVLIIVVGWIAPNALGQAFIIAQALVVAVFAEAQYIGLRRSNTVAA